MELSDIHKMFHEHGFNFSGDNFCAILARVFDILIDYWPKCVSMRFDSFASRPGRP